MHQSSVKYASYLIVFKSRIPSEFPPSRLPPFGKFFKVDVAVAIGIDYRESLLGLLRGRIGRQYSQQSFELVEIDFAVAVAIEKLEI